MNRLIPILKKDRDLCQYIYFFIWLYKLIM
nr:MAG TPA: hypothetical protein [Caudoviricetes sp.]